MSKRKKVEYVLLAKNKHINKKDWWECRIRSKKKRIIEIKNERIETNKRVNCKDWCYKIMKRTIITIEEIIPQQEEV